jgi:hypothetical protein
MPDGVREGREALFKVVATRGEEQQELNLQVRVATAVPNLDLGTSKGKVREQPLKVTVGNPVDFRLSLMSGASTGTLGAYWVVRAVRGPGPGGGHYCGPAQPGCTALRPGGQETPPHLRSGRGQQARVLPGRPLDRGQGIVSPKHYGAAWSLNHYAAIFDVRDKEALEEIKRQHPAPPGEKIRWPDLLIFFRGHYQGTVPGDAMVKGVNGVGQRMPVFRKTGSRWVGIHGSKGSTHVPIVFRAASVRKAHEVPSPATLHDILPTLCRMLDWEIPETAAGKPRNEIFV